MQTHEGPWQGRVSISTVALMLSDLTMDHPVSYTSLPQGDLLDLASSSKIILLSFDMQETRKINSFYIANYLEGDFSIFL